MTIFQLRWSASLACEPASVAYWLGTTARSHFCFDWRSRGVSRPPVPTELALRLAAS